MAAREIIFKFDRLSVGGLTIQGEANVEYSMDGTWEVVLAYVEHAFDEKGDEVEWLRISAGPGLRDKVAKDCAADIKSAVDEAIHWSK